jgi:aryl-alcohol dehydrogenase-like predicted oxidoreductase
MRSIAATHESSVSQVAIAWLLAHAAVGSVLLGATKLHQLEDNLAAADLTLTDAEIARLDAATPLPRVYPNWFIDNLADQAVVQALQP